MQTDNDQHALIMFFAGPMQEARDVLKVNFPKDHLNAF